MSKVSKIECHECGHPNEVDLSEKMGAYFWVCDSCGAECGMTVSYPIEDLMSTEELREHERKQNTFCNLHILYRGIEDIPKFKKYCPELKSKSNSELVKELRAERGLTLKNISLMQAESELEKLYRLGLETDVNV